jgi:hypothetical protein
MTNITSERRPDNIRSEEIGSVLELREIGLVARDKFYSFFGLT